MSDDDNEEKEDKQNKQRESRNAPRQDETMYTRIPYVPHILPEWTDVCNISENELKKAKNVELNDTNASTYAGISSHVGWKRRVNYALEHMEKFDSNPNDNLITSLLENVISAVITLASGEDLPPDYFITSSLFLLHIRNEFGEHPPNIAAFLELLKTKSQKTSSIVEQIDSQALDELSPNLVITHVPKSVHEKVECIQ